MPYVSEVFVLNRRSYDQSIPKIWFGFFTCRCVLMKDKFNCGRFDYADGLWTDNAIYPLPWKFSMVFMALGFIIMTITTFLTLATFCRQSIFGKSIHTITGSAQAIAGKHQAYINWIFFATFLSSFLWIFYIAICVLTALFLHPFGWGHDRVKKLCGKDSEPFWPSDCQLGRQLILGMKLSFYVLPPPSFLVLLLLHKITIDCFFFS